MPSRVVLLIMLSAAALFSQTTAGRFSGTVTDASGAAVPDVRITALNAETGQKLVEIANGEGRFVLYPLPPGVYTITAQKDGFSAFTIAGLKVDVSESVVRNISLQVGMMTQSVSVEAEAAAIRTDSPAIEATIVRQQIEELPLNGRDCSATADRMRRASAPICRAASGRRSSGSTPRRSRSCRRPIPSPGCRVSATRGGTRSSGRARTIWTATSPNRLRWASVAP